MSFRFTTASGSTYTIDPEHLKWSRRSDHAIKNHDKNEGNLVASPTVEIGYVAFLDMPDGTFVQTTPVTKIEEI